MENEPRHNARTLITNLDNEWECLRWQISTERENPLSYLSSVPDQSGRRIDGIEREVTDTGLHHMSGTTPGRPESPPLLHSIGEEDQLQGPEEIGFGCLPWQLSSMPESGRSEELCEKGWSIHLESKHGQPQRGECVATSTSVSKRRRHPEWTVTPGEQPSKCPRLDPPWGPDNAEPAQTLPPEDGNQTPTGYVQLEHPMGQESDPDLDWDDEYREDEYFEGAVAEWVLRHSHGST